MSIYKIFIVQEGKMNILSYKNIFPVPNPQKGLAIHPHAETGQGSSGSGCDKYVSAV
jgi:hypothetical protein